MQESDIQPQRLLSETDLELIDALQINPRASWTEVGAAIGVDPVTAARRWQRLHSHGEAWTTVALGPRLTDAMSMTFLEIDCEPGAAVEVAETLAGEGHLITVQHVASDHDLFAIAVAASMPALAHYLLTDLPRVPGVAKVRAHVATRVFETSCRWRLRVLPARSADALARRHAAPASTRQMDEIDRRLFKALGMDGRAGYSELAGAVGTSERTVQRRLSRLVATGDIDFRCDLARAHAGWHSSAVLWLRMPDGLLEETGRVLLGWPETRTCAALAGARNMLLTVGLHGVSDLHALVVRLEERFPHVSVADRQIVLRQSKLYGRLLDHSGHCTGVVPVDPWSLSRP
ncbi:AsnC family transcriptional regulator [Sphaerisporangium siamense]|uniref:DNA-binding Lrp family transcriptional regulator n=1 Tax=Sphaerisporangium siamense TaxID=795645 RepID=A0A7W7G7I1_9ACTN|nr:AsnC family transcriptional regulator [Sphaerisporangium siamense]MBB4698530.1 DNA-binding Lrp family transcriptional regulator [Sphaerisporangium siamense]GII85409.1 AsnC family transcriptional regulator [Sphaerisporangium siamense]